jgi:hypothetical protein
MSEQFDEITDVDGAGNPLRGQAVIQERRHPGRERDGGEQTKT